MFSLLFLTCLQELRKCIHILLQRLQKDFHMDTKFLANIKNEGAIPSLMVIIQLFLNYYA